MIFVIFGHKLGKEGKKRGGKERKKEGKKERRKERKEAKKGMYMFFFRLKKND